MTFLRNFVNGFKDFRGGGNQKQVAGCLEDWGKPDWPSSRILGCDFPTELKLAYNPGGNTVVTVQRFTKADHYLSADRDYGLLDVMKVTRAYVSFPFLIFHDERSL